MWESYFGCLCNKILAEVFVRPGAGYLWSSDFARNRIGHLNILGMFHIVLGIIDMVAPLLVGDSIGFLAYGGKTTFLSYFDNYET